MANPRRQMTSWELRSCQCFQCRNYVHRWGEGQGSQEVTRYRQPQETDTTLGLKNGVRKLAPVWEDTQNEWGSPTTCQRSGRTNLLCFIFASNFQQVGLSVYGKISTVQGQMESYNTESNVLNQETISGTPSEGCGLTSGKITQSPDTKTTCSQELTFGMEFQLHRTNCQREQGFCFTEAR